VLKENIPMQRIWVKVVLAVAVLFVVVVGVIPFLVNADTFRPKVETQLSSSLGRKVTLGHLSFSLLTGSLVAENISIADDPAFSTTSFLEAKQLRIGIELGQFLFHHAVRITNFTVDSPAIHLIHAQNGTWNFSSLGSAAAQPSAPAPQQESILPVLTVGEINIKDGSATLSSTPAAGKPMACTNINLSIKQFSLTNSFPFQLSLKLPGDGSFQLSGTAGPVAQKNAADTPFHAAMQLKHIDPVAMGILDSSQGISMDADFSAQLDSDGTNLISTGKIVASRLQLARGGSPAPHPVDIDYTISNNLEARTGQVSDISVYTGSVAAHVKGSYRSTAQAATFDLHLSAPNLPIDQLEAFLPAVGIHLPSGSSLHGGTLTANLAITGSASSTDIAGPVEVDNTTLSGFDLGAKIQGMNPVGGTGGGTEIQKLSAEVNVSPQLTKISNIDALVPKIGTASGSGTVSAAGALDFQMIANFDSSTALGAIAGSGVKAVDSLLSLRTKNNANGGVPLTITGTTSNPQIRTNFGSLLKSQSGSSSGKTSGQQKISPSGVLKGLFGK
jgi:AsmA protein